MNLIIDAGNTSVKFAVFDPEENIIFKSVEPYPNPALLYDILDNYQIYSAITSDVAGVLTPEFYVHLEDIRLLRMDSYTPVPIKVRYKNQKTLGTDRIAAAVGGYKIFPDDSVLVIQAGTCITYEYVSEEGVYHGGAISPGIDLRLKSLNTFTAHLPLIKKKQIDYITGRSTKEAMLSGVINGCIAETQGMIDRYFEKYGPIRVIIVGGDAFFFDKKLKNRIFAVENLVLQGLNHILNFNNAKD